MKYQESHPFGGGFPALTTPHLRSRRQRFETEPFTCPSCIKKIEGVVGKINGVESTQVMFNSNKVKVQFDEDLVSADTIARSISTLGYPVLSQRVA